MQQSVTRRQLTGVVVAATLGTLVDWYDFFVGATAAATVWPLVFFESLDPSVAFAYSAATYSVTYFSRPIGALLFGHYGDRLGRRNSLFVTLLISTIGVLGIGLTPAVLLWGPICLIVFRFIYGLGMGGEWGGAAIWIIETAYKSKRRGLLAGIFNSTVGFGTGTATVVFLILASMMSRPAYLSWGWRVAFIVGAVMLVAAFVIRYKTIESPVFRELKEKQKQSTVPAVEALKDQWKTILHAALPFVAPILLTNVILFPFSLAYVGALKGSVPLITLAISVASIAYALISIVDGYFADIIGRRWAYMIPLLTCFPALFIFFPLLNTLNSTLMVLAIFLFGIPTNAINATTATLIGEQFPAKYRQTCSGLSFGMSATIAGVMGAIISPLIISTYGILNAPPYLVSAVTLILIVTFIAAYTLKETKDVDLAAIK
jgi:MFS family permease